VSEGGEEGEGCAKKIREMNTHYSRCKVRDPKSRDTRAYIVVPTKDRGGPHDTSSSTGHEMLQYCYVIKEHYGMTEGR
jgi:hypothetical protein